MRILLVATSIAIGCLAACSSGAARKADGNAVVSGDQQADPKDKLASINPCSLLSDDEIVAQVDLTYEPDQRKAMHESGITHHVSKEEDRNGAIVVCHVSWHSLEPNGQESARGNFDVEVMTAEQLKAFEGMSRPKSGDWAGTIAGIGDQAFYLDHSPAARVGNLGVSISSFPATWGDEADEARGRVALLRAAAPRLR
jgi:hypothetical protein